MSRNVITKVARAEFMRLVPPCNFADSNGLAGWRGERETRGGQEDGPERRLPRGWRVRLGRSLALPKLTT